ncbi:hypothetical protein KCU87_g26, partial [Aureobasidium melanogenum]
MDSIDRHSKIGAAGCRQGVSSHLTCSPGYRTTVKLFCVKIIDTWGDDPARKTEGKTTAYQDSKAIGHAAGW